MLQFELKKYIINKEEDFIEDWVDKIRAFLTVCIATVWMKDGRPPLMTADLEVINLNTQTWEEMDAQRRQECLDFVTRNY